MKNPISTLVVSTTVLLIADAPLRAPDREPVSAVMIQYSALPDCDAGPARLSGSAPSLWSFVGGDSVDYFDPSQHKPWYGNYAGPGNNGYRETPIDSVDAAARFHDQAYDAVYPSQPAWGLVDCSVAGDDLLLGFRTLGAVCTDASLTGKGRAAGVVIAGIFLPLGTLKSSFHVDGHVALLDGDLAKSLVSTFRSSVHISRSVSAAEFRPEGIVANGDTFP